jgi:cytochrome c oxidase subunit 1
LTFFPLHILGYLGMPRRVYTYVPQMGWDNLNFLATMGACVLFLSVLLFLANVVISLSQPATAPDNPWNGESLEWATSSPPPHYNFKAIPVVEGRDAMWKRSDPMPVVAGVPNDKHEVLSTTILDAVPEHLTNTPGSSPFPFLLAVVTLAGMWGIIYNVWAWWPFCVFAGITLVAWYYRNSDTEKSPEEGF